MKTSIKTILLASCVAALSLGAAQARYHGHDDRGGAITFSTETGGYCDNAGCPDHFWRYPVHYGPVFVQGRWFRGPVYFRGDRYGREYWVRGGWHRDEWRGRRPGWAQQSHDGPPLAFEYYADHGFNMGDHWRHEHDGDNRDGDHGGGDHGGNRGDNGDRGDNGGGDHGDRNGNGGGDQGDRNGGGNGDWHRSDNGGADNGHGGNGDRNGGGRNQDASVIHVTAATYGGATCHQPTGNVTRFLSQACDGKKMCDYVVQYQAIGDPAPGCAKDFTVQWTCSAGPGGSTGAPAEAGLGSHVALQCANPGR